MNRVIFLAVLLVTVGPASVWCGLNDDRPEARSVQGPIDSPVRYRVKLGLGAGTCGIATVVSVTRDKGPTFITLRHGHTSDFLSLSTRYASLWDTGLLYGRSARSDYLRASLGAGVAYVRHRKAGGEIHYSALGFPAQIEVFTTPLPFAGLGVIGFTDLSPGHSFWGLALALQFGNLR